MLWGLLSFHAYSELMNTVLNFPTKFQQVHKIQQRSYLSWQTLQYFVWWWQVRLRNTFALVKYGDFHEDCFRFKTIQNLCHLLLTAHIDKRDDFSCGDNIKVSKLISVSKNRSTSSIYHYYYQVYVIYDNEIIQISE